MKKIVVLFLFALFLFSGVIHAQSSISVSHTYQIEGAVRPGMIVTNDGTTIQLSTSEYAAELFGVVIQTPGITVNQIAEEDGYPVAINGYVPVLVSNTNGTIQKGDYVTSSSQSGIGMKARKPGPVIGTAVEDAAEYDSEYELVMVSIHPEYAEADSLFRVGDLIGKISDYNLDPLVNTLIEPKFVTSVRYTTAGIILVIALAGSILYYIQLSKMEVEALGRNPLASDTIRKEVLKHAIVVVSICIIGLALAYAIVRL